MTKRSRWIRRGAIGLGAVVAVLAALAGAIAIWVPNDNELARRVEAEFEARLGEKLTVGDFAWQVFPVPAVVARNMHTHQDEPIQVGLIEIRPQLWPLLHRRVVINSLRVENAVVPRNSLKAFRGKSGGTDDSAFKDFTLQRLEFSDVSYTSYSGVAVPYSGEIDFDPDWRPRTAHLRRPRSTWPAVLDLLRDGQADRWAIKIRVAGGTAHGKAELATGDAGRMTLTGELAPREVEIQALMDTFNRRSPLSGDAAGHTVFDAQGDNIGELVRSLHSRSELTATQAKVLRIDLDKAVKSLGKERAGQTVLDTLSGQVDTQNTENGMKTSFTNVKATSGRYSASGNATIYQRQLQAEGKLSIAGGLVDVPFSASGPVRKPELTISRGLFAGAAIGTAVLPGIGTVIGAKIGAALSGSPKPATPDAAGKSGAAARPVSPRRQ